MRSIFEIGQPWSELLAVIERITEDKLLTLRSTSIVAKTALKRKKAHEHSLEQTQGQVSMLEQQIYSIESGNINQETLLAMKNAG